VKRRWIIPLGLMLVIGVLAGTSIAGAEEASAPPTDDTSGTEALAPSGLGGEFDSGDGEASLLAGCEANVICVYTSVTYGNIFGWINCSFSGVTPPAYLQSATNRCGNKTNWLRLNGTTIACMNPGGNRPHPGVFNEVFVAAQYGAFC